MNQQTAIDDFLSGQVFAVVGASDNRAKYGNMVLRCLLQNGRRTFSINPRGGTVEGLEVLAGLDQLPEPVHGVSIIVPPAVTMGVVEDAARLGIKRLWMQPGAESPAVLQRAEELGLHVIAGGPCLLVALGFRDV